MCQQSTIARHLSQHSRITPGAAVLEYKIFRLAAVIHRLRTSYGHLLPKGKQIKMNMCQSVSGNKYAEYQLVNKEAA